LSNYPTEPLGEVALNLDRLRVPLSSRERATRQGAFPYYGAAGILDSIDDFLFEGLHVLVGEDGSVENPAGRAVLQLADGRFWVNNHAHVLRADSPSDTRYLYFALSTVKIRPYLTGSVQFKLTQTNLNRIRIPYPEKQVRSGIVGLLGTLDDKIDLNRRMNETLQQAAAALFSRTFKGVPEIRLADEFDVTMGQSPPGETYNAIGEGAVFFQGRTDFGFRFPTDRVYCSAPTRSASAGDTLVSVRAPVGDVNMALNDCAIGRGVAAVRHKSGSRSLTYYAMRFLRPTLEIFDSEGTVFGSLSKKDFARLFVPRLSDRANEFERLAAPLDLRIELNERESRTLAGLRDALLPKLISGELRVRDAEVAVERAT
jgi:type I restriction enzyme, S subunit